MLEVRNVGKQYGKVVALDDVSATFRRGEIHAVLGENGAGKSTLMNVLSGFAMPDAGTVHWNGRPVPPGDVVECKRLGIELIHQHFTLVPDFTVAENFALSQISRLLEGARIEERARPSLEAADRLGWPIDSAQKVRNLPVGVQQRLEILKALGRDAQALILDEPTAVLSPDEIEDLFRVLRRLRDEDRVVILIAHKLSEVLAVADRVTVLRRGKVVGSAPRSEIDAPQLARWMVGEVPLLPEAAPVDSFPEGGLDVSELFVDGDRGESAIRGISLAIQRGEILGIGGVDGNGQIELAEAVAGIRPFRGNVTWAGRPMSNAVPRIGYVPQDRQIDGLAMGMSVEENLLVGNEGRRELSNSGFLRRKAIRRWVQNLVRRFEIRVSDPSEAMANLSGGNQQKVVVSRTLDAEPELLVVVNPTRGLDIRASVFVHSQLLAARKRGAAILLVSTDLDELAGLSDRTLFLSRGQFAVGSREEAFLGGFHA